MKTAHDRRKASAAGAIFLVCCSAVFALNPSLDIGQFGHKSWKVREGFFNGLINTITQTPDGYLWVGTDSGLYRFDGFRSVLWQPRENKSLPSRVIRKLFVSRDGTLWIGTQKGLASWKDTKLTLYPESPAEAVDALAEDSEGTVWVGLEEVPVWRLCAIKKMGVQCFGDNGTIGLGGGALFSDRKGSLWAGTGTGLWRWKPGSPLSVPLSGPLSEIHAFIEDTHGAILVSSRGGIIRLTDSNNAAYRLPGYDQQFNPFGLLRDREGSLWVGTKDRGLLHVHEGRTDHFGKSDGLSSDYIADLFEDREGNIWVGTASGLDQFREFAVSTMSDTPGFSAASVESLLTASDGSIWLGTRDGLDRWQDGKLTLYRKRRAQPSTVRQVIDPGLPDDFHSTLHEDHRGRIWTFSRAGAAYLDERGRFVRVRDLPGGFAHSIGEDSAGDLWISEDQGFFHLLRGGKVKQIPWAKLGTRGLALAVAGDPSRGGLWLGFSQGGVAYFKDGEVHQWYTPADGLGEGRVNKLRVDHDGTLWAGTEGGLGRLQNGRLNTLSSQNGLPCNSVHEFVQDDAQSMWLHTSCGLVRISRSDLDAWVADPKLKIHTTVFDSSDGLTPVAFPRGLSPRMGKATDKKIWFVSGDGVSVLDPQHLPFNTTPPPVHVEQIIADGKTYSAFEGLRLPSLVRDLAIDYTALSLIAPEKIHFRYNLQGQDSDWREVVNARQVQYSNLAPGNYRFRVIASNNSGAWNEEGATLDFVIPPAWFQTKWFRAVCVAVVLALIWLSYRYRIRGMEEREKRFRDAVESMPALAFIALSENERTFVNKGWVEYTGLTVELASGSGWQAAVHPDDLKGVLDKWRAAQTAGEPFEYEVRLLCATEGEYRWFHTRVVPVKERRGKIIRWCGVATDIEDRKRAEENVKQQEMELRQVLDLTPLLVAVFGPDRERLYANQPSLDYIGMTLEKWQSIPDHLWFFHPDDRERIARDVYNNPENRVPHEFEARFRKGDGTYRWFLFRENPVRDELGRITHRYLSATDIEDRKHSEQALRRSEGYLTEAQRLTHTCSWASDGKTHELLYWSGEWFRIFGLDPNKGSPTRDQMWQRIHPEDRAKVKQASDKTFREKTEYDVEYRIVLPNGTVKYIHSIGHPVLNADGEIIEVIGTNVDITKPKRAEEALRESETRFRKFVDHTADAFFMLDFDQGTIIDVNQPACESLGYTREELLGKTPLAFDVSLDQATFESLAGRVAAGETVLFDRHWHRRKNGSTFPVEVQTSIFHHGGRRFLLKVAHDITDRQRAEEEHNKLRQLEADLAHTNRVSMMGELTASIAHEVNQPLSGVVSNGSACLRWLAAETPNMEEAREAARRIVRDGKRAGEVIARVRALTRKTETIREKLDVNETIREVLAIVSDEAKKNKVMVETQFAEDIFPVRGDHVQLQQVLMNLMLNGIEAMKDTGGVLGVKSQAENGHVVVSVSDTGVGLPAEKAGRIFDAFFTTKPQGTGMGLAISRSIVESHGGRLWATPNGGGGAIFHFTLPAETPQADAISNVM